MIPEEPKPREAGIGHNQPPSPIDVLVAEQREALTPDLKDRLEYIVERADKKEVNDRVSAGDAGDIIKVAHDFMDVIEKARIERTRPYRDAADRAKAIADEFVEPLRAAVDRLRARLKAWDREEDKRIAAQAAEQEAFFSKPNPTPDVQSVTPSSSPPSLRPAKRRKIVGDLGARVTRAEVKTYRVVDVRKVPDMILNSPTVHEAIIQVVKSMAKHLPSIDGIEITTDLDTRVQ